MVPKLLEKKKKGVKYTNKNINRQRYKVKRTS